MKFVVKMLPERKRVLENRCKGKHYFPNFQIFLGKNDYLCTQNVISYGNQEGRIHAERPDGVDVS